MSYTLSTTYREDRREIWVVNPPINEFNLPEVSIIPHFGVTIELDAPATTAQHDALQRARTVVRRRRSLIVGRVVETTPTRIVLEFSNERARDAFVDRFTREFTKMPA